MKAKSMFVIHIQKHERVAWANAELTDEDIELPVDVVIERFIKPATVAALAQLKAQSVHAN